MTTTGILTPERRIESSAPLRRLPAGPDKSRSPLGGLSLAMAVGITATWAAYEVAHGKYYTPRSNFGFYLGVAGTLMMLALLTYPLRKRVRWMQRWGALKHWFRIHMWMGVLGPTLVLFHSTFHIRSTNAAVALFSMLFVVASGIVGRFVYTQIHYGLYGRRASLEKLQEELFGHSDQIKSRTRFAPQVEERVKQFEQAALEQERTFPFGLVFFIGLGLQRQYVEFRCKKDFRHVLRADPNMATREQVVKTLPLLSLYLREVQRVAQFSGYEQLFSLWHLLHVPLIVLLAASTIFHVIAVYMY
ncbi:hypothetical protein [Petrachloros mirabilis]